MDSGMTSLKSSPPRSMCLYIFSPSKHDRLYQLQMDTLSDRMLTLTDHHITIAEVFEHEQGYMGENELACENSHGLRQQFHIMPGQFRIVLASDSAVKLSAESCVSCEEVIMRIENKPVETRSYQL